MKPVEQYLKDAPLVAILRGVTPDEILAQTDAIVGAGWTCLEVPLNSPDALKSIRILTQHYGDKILIGAGTVLSVNDVTDVYMAGGKLIVSPNINADVINLALKNGMVVMPGFFTPTEAFAAYDLGIRYGKLFPADTMGPAYIRAIKAVLPKDFDLIAVGGVSPDNLAEFHAAGAVAYGIGSQLYKPGRTPQETGQRAADFIAASRAVAQNR